MLNQKQKVHFKAVEMLLLATLFWGVSFPVIKALALLQQSYLPGANSWLGAALTSFVRFSFAAMLMLPWCYRSLKKLTFLEFWQGFGLGVFGGLGILFQMDGLNYTDASTSAFLTQAYCMIIPIIVAVRDRKVPSMLLVASCVLMMIGIAILNRFDMQNLKLGRGEAETLIASLIFAGQILWLERPIFTQNNVNNFSFVMFVTMAMIALPVLLFNAVSFQQIAHCYSQPSVLSLTLILTLVCTLLAYLLMNYWQPFVPAAEAAVIYGVEPVSASIFALFLPAIFSRMFQISYGNEVITSHLFWGGGLIVAANLLLQWRWIVGKVLPKTAKSAE
ncbi:MAG: DMT family transporter [Verrucomicrobiales bacterium]